MSDDADVMTDIEMLKAVEEIRQVEARYARYADEKRWADLAGLFTVDGTFTPLDVGGQPLAVMSGRQEIADLAQNGPHRVRVGEAGWGRGRVQSDLRGADQSALFSRQEADRAAPAECEQGIYRQGRGVVGRTA